MVYFDNAATTFPKPACVWREIYKCGMEYCGNPGRSGHYYSVKTGRAVWDVRERIAEALKGEDASHILFTKNATEALNAGLKGILKSGNHVITTSMEHNSVLRPLKELEKYGIQTTVVRGEADGSVRTENIRKAIRPETAMIVCTMASNVCGTILPVEEIGALAVEKGILFFVDGSQGLGSLPLTIERTRADLVAAPGHKGLLGPQGTGFLYVGRKAEKRIHPLLQGGTGTASKSTSQPAELPEGLEAGTGNSPGIVGLGAGVRWIAEAGGGDFQKGVFEIGQAERALILRLDEALGNMDAVERYGPENGARKGGITAFNVKGQGCEEVARQLWDSYGIAVRAGFHCAGLAHKTIGTWNTGAVRISVGPFNTKKEIDRLAEAVYRIAEKHI